MVVGSQLAGSEDGVIHVWKTDTGAAVRQYSDGDLTHPVHDVAFHPHDNIVASASFGAGQPIVLYYAGWTVMLSGVSHSDR